MSLRNIGSYYFISILLLTLGVAKNANNFGITAQRVENENSTVEPTVSVVVDHTPNMMVPLTKDQKNINDVEMKMPTNSTERQIEQRTENTILPTIPSMISTENEPNRKPEISLHNDNKVEAKISQEEPENLSSAKSKIFTTLSSPYSPTVSSGLHSKHTLGEESKESSFAATAEPSTYQSKTLNSIANNPYPFQSRPFVQKPNIVNILNFPQRIFEYRPKIREHFVPMPMQHPTHWPEPHWNTGTTYRPTIPTFKPHDQF